LPRVSRDLHIDGSAAQLTLSACLIGLALGQLFGGPLSDAAGRRGPLLAGVGAYTLFSLCCAVSPNVATLIAARFLQGFAGGIAIVISTAGRVTSGPRRGNSSRTGPSPAGRWLSG